MNTIETISLISNGIMGIVLFIEKMNPKVSPTELEKRMASEREYTQTKYVQIEMYKDLKGTMDKIYDAILKNGGCS